MGTQGNAPVSQPIVFISHFQLKSGGLHDYRRLAERVTRQLDAERPRTVAFLHYLDAERSRVTIVHIFPDAPAMDAHFEGATDRSKAAFQYITPAGWEIYGQAGDAAVATIREAAKAAGVELVIAPQHLGGFMRFGSR